MGTKHLTEPVIWKSYSDDTMFQAVGLPREPFIDKRDGTPKLRIFDGVTPGGRAIGGGLLNTISTPVILSPLDGVTGISFTPILTASAYNAVSIAQNPHQSTWWQIATDNIFTNVVYESKNDTVNLESIDLDAMEANPLDAETTYYVRVRYTSSSGRSSEWSPIISFMTGTPILNGIQAGKMYAPDAGAYYNYGAYIALSGDKTTLAVVAYASDYAIDGGGAIYVYVKSGASWVLQSTLTPDAPIVSGMFGRPVSLSYDGNTLVAGGYQMNGTDGSFYIFTRSGSTWTQRAKKLPLQTTQTTFYGFEVSISADGNTIAASSPYINGGVVDIYRRTGETWTVEQTVSGADTVSGDNFGYRQALSADGNTLIVGAYSSGGEGAAYIFTRSGSTWTQQSKLLPSNPISGGRFGISVAVSSDGNTVLIGAEGYNNYEGTAYVFTRSGATWTQQTQLSITGGAIAGQNFGNSVAISADGNTALVGSAPANGYTGEAYIFTRLGTVWAQTYKLVASDGVVGDYFSTDVALASDGTFAVIGAGGDDDMANVAGAVYIFN